MSAAGRRVGPFPAGTRTPRGPPDLPKVLKSPKIKLKNQQLDFLGKHDFRTLYHLIQRPETYP